MVTLVETSPTSDPASLAPRCEVAEAAISRLRQSPYPVLRKVSCKFVNGVLTLRGSVPTFYLKQIAQTVVLNIPRVTRIDNRIEVAL